MKAPAEDNDVKKNVTETKNLRTLRHDIYNQLSNIYLAVEQLRHELPDDAGDCSFYLDSIFTSAAKINSLLKETE